MSHPLERIYDEHAQSLFSFLLNLTRSEPDTRDVMQEIFRKLAERPELLRGVREVRPFLLRLAHNQAIDLMRRRSTREKNYADLARECLDLFAASPQADEESLRKALSAALEELPPDQRAVAHLKLWEGATFEQIAETLGIPANTAASRYRYAMDKLRQRLRLIYEEIKQ